MNICINIDVKALLTISPFGQPLSCRCHRDMGIPAFWTSPFQKGSFLHEHARPLNKRLAWRLTTGSAFIKMARLIENTSWKVLAYGVYARVVDVSEIERVNAGNE